MAKYKVIHIDIYNRDITVFIGSHEEFIDWVSNCDCPASWDDLIETIKNSDNEHVEASYWYNSNNGNGIIELAYHPKSPYEIGVAAHESLHATFRILDFIGVPLYKDEANESYTYLHEHILKNLLSFDDYNIINL